MCEHGTQYMAFNCDCWVCAQRARPSRKGLVLAITLGLLAAWGLGSVKAQEARPPHGHAAHEMALHDKFYSAWMQPPARKTSCCNKEDCYRTTVLIERGICKAWKLPSAGVGWDEGGNEIAVPAVAAHWVTFPCSLLEENLTDAEESPDGESHACIAKYTDQVYCAVRGSLQ